MVVGFEYGLDADAEVMGEIEIGGDLEARVDDGSHAGFLITDEIRGATGIIVRDLTENHLRLASG